VTLKRHGATEEEIAFLRNDRVELNAVTSRQLIDLSKAARRARRQARADRRQSSSTPAG
jgi:hypothetical protein